MKSATAISYELDDITAAAKELTSQIRGKFSFENNTIAILYGQPDMDIGALSETISHELGCHVIGGTTAAGALITNEGYHELAIVLHVLSGDDCIFSAAISGSLETRPEKSIKDTYQKAYLNLKEQDAVAEPKMVICAMSIIQSIASDKILEIISRLCGSLPVFGFSAGDDFEFCKQQVYLDGEIGGDRLALILLSGNVQPVFHTASLMGRQVLDKRLVTKAHDNVIVEIEGKPAFEYIKGFPFIDNETTALFNYQFFVEMQGENSDGIPVSRALNSFNKETGELSCFANIPQNSFIGLFYCDGKDIALSSEVGMKDFLSKLSAISNGYEYSTVLIVSCSLRNMYLAGMKEKEGELAGELIPPGMTVSGLYAFGEIAPTSIIENKAVNRFHNATFTICAF